MFVIHREEDNPIIKPLRQNLWESVATTNPSAVHDESGVRMYYRAIGNPDALTSSQDLLSTIGTTFSEDGIHFHSRSQVIAPKELWDAYGCEDPRATFFEGKWYVFYTALGGYPFGPDNIKVAVAVGDSPEEFTERHLVTPFNAKAATLFPERINGDVVLMLTVHTDWTQEHPKSTIGIARAKNIQDFWEPTFWEKWHENLPDHAISGLLRSDDDHVEVGAPPIKTEAGWLFLYSYAQHYYDERKRIFSVEAALLNFDDPKIITSRTYPFLVPEETYEQYGLVPNVVFPSSATVYNDKLEIWYGAADTVCAKATVRLSDLLRSLSLTNTSRTLIRSTENPILRPQGNGFEESAVFNTASFDFEGSIYLLYRAMGSDNTSTIGCAKTKDGIHIDERFDSPIYVPRADFEQKKGDPNGNSGCEDPRVSIIGNILHMTYTAYDGVHPAHGAYTSISLDDFRNDNWDAWKMPVLITPRDIDDKDVGLLPKTIEGNYLMYHRVSNNICVDIIHSLSFEKPISRCIEILLPREGMWDSVKVGIAGPPIHIENGWLLIYHAVSHSGVYRFGVALLKEDGVTVIARTADPIFEPVESYEKDGVVNKVVFSCGAVVRDDTIFVYYGGGDRVIGVATGSMKKIIHALRNT